MKIKISIFFFVFSFFLKSCVLCQEITFEYILSTDFDERVSDIFESQNNNIYITGVFTNILHPYNNYGLILKLDKYGELIDSIHIGFPGKGMYINNFHPIDNQNYLIPTSIYDTLGTFKNSAIVFYNMDNDLNLTNQITNYLPPEYRCTSFVSEIEENGNILVGGSIYYNSNTPRPFLYEFNSDLDSLKAKFYVNDYGVVSHVKKLHNGNYWFTKDLHKEYQLVDSSLNYLSSQKVPENLTANFGVKWDTDTSFYLLGDKIYPLPSHNLGFIKQYHPIDTTEYIFNEWGVSDTIDFPAAWNGIDFKNKDSIFIGGTRNFWFWFYNNSSWFIILQTDSMLNIRWERFYGGDAYYVMCNLITTNDGGCLVAGTRYDYQHVTEEQTDIIILKLNSDGLLVNTDEKPVIQMHEALVYPNPGINEIRVRVAAQYPQSLFRLFDMNGKEVLEQKISGRFTTVNSTFLKPGTYIYRITSSDGLYETGKWVRQ